MTVADEPQQLKRVLTLPLVILYGLGITIGAGIYVLIGETAGRAGMLAPLSFVLAAIVMLFPALAFAELACRYPSAAGAAQFSEQSFRSRSVGLGVGVMMMVAGVVAASTIALGSSRYLGALLPLPQPLLLACVVIGMGIIAAWGIRESVFIAAVMTAIEIGGLVLVIIGGLVSDPSIPLRLGELVPAEFKSVMAVAVLQASLLAVFAYIGFEGIANIAEETIEPKRTLPRAILATLILSALIYVLVLTVALMTVGPKELASQQAPLTYLFRTTTGLPGGIITVIAVIATLNGIIVQIITVSRLLFGLARRGLLPSRLAILDPGRQTPTLATIITTAAILALALSVDVVILAEWTARILLAVFAIASAGLCWLKLRGDPAPAGAFVVPLAIPAIGTFGCLLLLIADLFMR